MFLQREAQVYNAAAEIGVGFLLIIQLFTAARSLMLTLCYWCVPPLLPACAARRQCTWRGPRLSEPSPSPKQGQRYRKGVL